MKRLFIVSIVLFFGCQTTGSVPDGMTLEQVASEKMAIEAVIDGLAETWNREDFEGYCSLWIDNSKLIRRNGNVVIIKRADDEKRIQEFKEMRTWVGTSEYRYKRVRVLNPLEATATAEFVCSTCNKGGEGRAETRFKFFKLNGKWLVLLRDIEKK